jgi:tyrocidine synthetase III
MSVEKLFNELKGQGIEFRLLGGQLKLSAPKGVINQDVLEIIKTQKDAFIQLLEAQSRNGRHELTPVAVQEHYRLSHAQQRMWVLDQLAGRSAAFNMPAAFVFEGKLDVGGFSKAFDKLVARHEILRTIFLEIDGEPRQKVLPVHEHHFALEYTDLSTSSDPDEAAAILAGEEQSAGFDLAEGPLLRARLLQVSYERYVFLFTMHHIISDGWSMEVLTREVLSLYMHAGPVEDLKVQYKDFAEWQYHLLQDGKVNAHREYWMKQLQGELPVLDLPPYRPRPAVQGFSGEQLLHRFPVSLSAELNRLSRKHDASLFMTVISVLNVLFYKYTGQRDIVLGTSVAGRDHKLLEGQIGLYLNTLAIRSRFEADENFRSLLLSTRERILEAYDHQQYPFDKLVDDLQLERDMSRSAVFDVLVEMENFGGLAGVSSTASLPGLEVRPYEQASRVSQLDLNLVFGESDGALYVSAVFNTDLFERSDISRLIAHFEQLALAIVKDPLQSISSYAIADDTDLKLLEEFNQTDKPFDVDKTFIDEIEEQVHLRGEAVALSDGEHKITYRDLWEQSGNLAKHLLDQGLQAEEVVALIAERSIDFPKYVLGIMRAGGVYLPISPNNPAPRTSLMLRQSQTRILLIDPNLLTNELSSALNEHQGLTILNPSDLKVLSKADAPSKAEAPSTLQPSNLQLPNLHRPERSRGAYLIYTSGSTGLPKGALLEHAGMLNHLYAKVEELGLNGNSVIVQNASQTFDISIWQMFAALITGGRTVIYNDNLVFDPAAFLLRLQYDEVSVVEVVPSYLVALLDELERAGQQIILPNLQQVMVTGETLQGSLVRRWFKHFPDIPLINAYGPTEASDDITHYRIDAPIEGDIVPIGKAIRNLRIYIVNDDMQLCPVGVKGEICVSGIGVGRGYINDADRTEAVFLEDPFRKEKGVRMYRTGDLGRYREDGVIEFYGRRDSQVKIRGHRIELGEIESRLSEIAGIKEAVVVVKGNADRFLVAYVRGEGLDINMISASLRESLPGYMIHGIIHILDVMPVTESGKIDRQALARREDDINQAERSYAAAENATQQKLVAIWQEVLNKEHIGIRDNFFESGGHSLKAVQIVSRVHRELGVKLELRHIFLHVTIEALSKLIDEQQQETYTAIEPIAEQPYYELSHAQRRLWILDQLEPGQPTYNIPAAYELEGALNIPAFENAFNALIEKHESLRTIFIEVDSKPYQQVLSMQEQGFIFVYRDLRTENDPLTMAKQLAGEEAVRPFSLSDGPLLRAQLLQMEDDRYIFLFTMHHIISDGWSMEVITREVLGMYESFTREEVLSEVEPVLSAVDPSAALRMRIQYKDYAAWQHKLLNTSAIEPHRKYWLQRFGGEVPVLELPADKPRPAVKTYSGQRMMRLIDKNILDALHHFSRQQGTSLFITLMASVRALLYRYTGQEDMVLGTVVAGRDHKDLEEQIGFYVNTLALRGEVKGSWTFSELVQKVNADTLEAFSHQVYPFDKLVDELQLERNLGRNPLFDVLVILQNTTLLDTSASTGIQVRAFEQPIETSKFDWTISFAESAQGLWAGIEFNTDLFLPATIGRMLDHYTNLLTDALQQHEQPLAQLMLLSKAEEHQLLHAFNDTTVEYPQTSIAALFTEQAAKTPDEPAVIFGEAKLTYRELDERSSQLASYIQQQAPEADRIPICIDRSMEMVIGVLGIIKSGAAYVPIDPGYPTDRIHWMLQDTAAPLIITSEACRHLVEKDSAIIILLDSDEAKIYRQPTTEELSVYQPQTTNPKPQTTNNKLIYVIYTSGSTGRPKGVEMPEAALVNLLLWQQGEVKQNRHRNILQFASLNFDASFQEIFFACCFGGTVFLIDEERRKDAAELVKEIMQQKITHLFIPFVVLKSLAEYMREWNIYPSSMEAVLTAGEQLKLSDDIEQMMQRTGMQLLNYYGPSETHVVSSYEVKKEDFTERKLPPIGKPISNTQLYIVDSHQNLVPIGVPGELYIGGVQVAKGYQHQPELTKERFVIDPFKGDHSKMYRSGDIARWLPDGNVEFLGRKDDQLKIRGYRVELGEVEAALLQVEGVQQCVVIAREHGNEKQLIGYLVYEGTFDKEVITQELGKVLPDYMVPAILVQIETIPLTSNGKVDKKQLPEADLSVNRKEYIAPRTATEQAICNIWQEVLASDRIGIRDHFFESGGHSLKAVQLVSRIHRVLGVQLPLRAVFMHPTVEGLASLVDKKEKQIYTSIPKIPDQPHYGLSHAQRRLWVLDQLQPGQRAYNLPEAYLFEGELDVEAFNQAFDQLVARHEILRTIFIEVDGEPRQQVLSMQEQQFTFSHIDLRGQEDREAQAAALAAAESNIVFNLSEGPLLRAGLVQLEDDRYVFLLTMHHIISDGWSMEVLTREVLGFYEKLRNVDNSRHQVPFTAVNSIQYRDYAAWQQEQLQGENLRLHQQYWRKQLESPLPALDLPPYRTRPAVQRFEGDYMVHDFSAELSASLNDLARQHDASLFMVLVSVINVLFYKYTGQPDVILGTSVAGRNHKDLEDQLGFYLNTLAIRNRFSSADRFTDLLQSVRKTILDAYDHQQYPFDRLVDDLQLERDMSRSAIFDVLVEMQNFGGLSGVAASGSLSGLKIAPYPQEKKTSQLDLTLAFQEENGRLSVLLIYNTDLFTEKDIRRISSQFTQLAGAIADDPGKRIGSYELLSAEDVALLDQFNRTDREMPEGETLLTLIESQVHANPGKAALVSGNETISYETMWERSANLAGQLLNNGLEPEQAVGLLCGRSESWVIATLAIMRAGGVYLPIGTSNPVQRMAMLLNESGASILVTDPANLQDDLIDQVAAATQVNTIICLDETEGIELKSLRFRTQLAAARMLTQPAVAETSVQGGFIHNNIIFSELEVRAQAERLFEWLLPSMDPGDAVAIMMQHVVYRIIAAKAMQLGVFRIVLIAPTLSLAEKRRQLQEAGVKWIITEAAMVDEADLLAWSDEHVRGYALIDNYQPAGADEVKDSLIKEVWEYEASKTSTAINDYGWTNSYTNEAFSLPEMQQYIDNFKEKLDDLIHPDAKVLEIGCGHGLVLFNMAPHAGYYLATDISETIIEKNRERARQESLPNVDMLPLSAIQIGTIDKKDFFDVVVCSSAVHYFPNTRYLRQVIISAIELLNGQGVIYLDDLMDLRLKPLLEASAREYNERHGVRTAKENWDNDLFIDRDFFEQLAEEMPEVAGVEFSAKKTVIENELTRYRYDVLLRIDKNNVHKSTVSDVGKRYLEFDIERQPAVTSAYNGPYYWWLPPGGLVLNAVHKQTALRTPSVSDALNGLNEADALSALSKVDALSEAEGPSTLQQSNTPTSNYHRPNRSRGAYLIYTSGSTGLPKGALLEHAGMLNHLYAKVEELGLNDGSVIVQNASQTFDISIWQMFAALITGGRTVIYNDNLVLDPAAFLHRLQYDEVSVVEVVPSYLVALLDELERAGQQIILSNLQQVMVTGETLQGSLVRRWFKHFPNIPLINAYGPTEASDDIMHYRIDAPIEGDIVPIGKAIRNLRIYIVNDDMQLCPIGVKGEICVSGIGVGRGYINDADRTAAVFIEDPFRKEKGVRMYRTGDLGRYREDGVIEFYGRRDSQVKIRGHRIELGEIEARLSELAGVREAVVVVKGNADRYLVAYVRGEGFDINMISVSLRETLPGYMIPGIIHILDVMPVTESGKIDRQALARREDDIGQTERDHAAAENATQEKLIDIWQEVLNKENIGIRDNFFESGGHSLKAVQIVSRVHRELGVKLELRDIFLHVTIEALSKLIDAQQQEVYTAIEPIPSQPYYELSHAQRRLWVLDQLEPDEPTYNIPGAFVLRGKLDTAAFEQAFHALVRRHEILRTVFLDIDGHPYQRVLSMQEQRFQLIRNDLRTEPQAEARARQLADEEALRPFSLVNGPLLRAQLLQMEDDRYIFLFTMHHIISDGWSMEVLTREVLGLYEQLAQGKVPSEIEQTPTAVELTPSAVERSNAHRERIQYKDYAAWQNNLLQTSQIQSHRAFWLDQFSGEIPVLEMPADFPRPLVATYRGSTIDFTLDASITRGLKELSSQEGVSLFMTLVSSLNVLLHRYTGQDEIVIGTVTAGRDHNDLEDQIGFYVNTLALRNQVHSSEPFTSLLSRVRNTTLNAFEHQLYPFDKLVGDLSLVRDRSRSPLFDVMVVLQNIEGIGASDLQNKLQGLQVSDYPGELKVTKFDLTFQFKESGDVIEASIHYNSDLYLRSRMERTVLHLSTLFAAVTENRHQSAGSMHYLPASEQQELMHFSGLLQPAVDNHDTLHGEFEKVSQLYPDRISISGSFGNYTYAELRVESDKLAHHLMSNLQLQPGEIIAVMLDNTSLAVVGMLAIMKAGGVYLPVDPAYPAERKSFILSDASVRIILTESAYIYDLLAHPGMLVALDIELPGFDLPEHPVKSAADGNSLAYVIYTSGSTGLPKGVLVAHHSCVNMVREQVRVFGVSAADEVLQFASLSFDASISETFMALHAGAGLVLPDRAIIADAPHFIEYMQQHAVTVVTLPPAYLRTIDRQLLRFLRVLITAGEKAHAGDALECSEFLEYFNAYGPTECAVCATIYKVGQADQGRASIPIGRPLANTGLLVLDKSCQLSPIGVEGEICVTGVQLAAGYLNRPALTAEKFVWIDVQGRLTRIYRTGDTGRYDAAGNVEYIGRADHQVKVRGYRIETGEIENRLLQVDGIEAAVVLVKEAADGDRTLLAFITGMETDVDPVRDQLKLWLPAYMVPDMIRHVAALPLTVSGKIDRLALLSIDAEGTGTGEYHAPGTPMQQQLCAIWQEVLGLDRISIRGNFFEIGGHSLRAVQIVSRIHKELGIKIELKDVFSYPTVEELALLLENSRGSAFEPIPKVEDQPHYELSPGQRRLWVLDQMEPGQSAYNIPAGFELYGKLDLDAFRRSFEGLVWRHEILRTIFIEVNGEPRQKILSMEEQGFRLAFTDLREDPDREEVAKEMAGAEDSHAFSLSTGPLLRAQLIQLEDERYLFLFTMHHIISDGWSMEVLARQVLGMYEARTPSGVDPSTALRGRIQYKDYAAWQNNLLQSEAMEEHRNYWLQQFQSGVPVLDLPSDRPRPVQKTFAGGEVMALLNEETVKGLKQLGNEQGASLFITLLACVHALLHRYTGQQEIVTGTTVAGRDHPDLEDQLGFYVNTLALKNEVDSAQPFEYFLKQTRDRILESYRHQIYPFDKLVDELQLERDMSRSPLFDVLVELINTTGEAASEAWMGMDVRPYEVASGISKFDLSFRFLEQGAQVVMILEYNSDLFDRERVVRMAEHVKNLLQVVIEGPGTQIGRIGYVGDEERFLMEGWNETGAVFSGKTLVDLYDEQVLKTPDAVAVQFGGESFTYHHIFKQANNLAAYLRSQHGIQPGDVIAISAQRSERLIIGVLGILKSGGVLLPIDSNYPKERKRHILQDAGAKVLLTESYDVFEIDYFSGALFTLDLELPMLPAFEGELRNINTLDHTAYLLYTSGSTGTPKGVAISHDSISNYIQWANAYYFNNEAKYSFAFFTSLSFDLTLTSLFTPLLRGDHIDVQPEVDLIDTLKSIFENTSSTRTVKLTPSHVQMLSGMDIKQSNIEIAILGGEALTSEHVRILRSLNASMRIFNEYGPTETTVGCVVHEVGQATEASIPIGRPIANTKLYVLDDSMQLQPLGFKGELWIGGAGVAKGYVNNETLNEQKFKVLNNKRVYRSGDIVRYREDGILEYFGRKDEQVKLRGYRIELSEIETALLKLTNIRQAAVIVKDQQLAAFVTSEEQIQPESIKEQMLAWLPSYMVPSSITLLEKIPLTSNGKADRKALEVLHVNTQTQTYKAPSTPIEQTLANIWQEVLGTEQIGVHDNFFEAGGHSLRAVQIVSRIHRELGVKIELREIFAHPTIESLAILVNQQTTAAYEQIHPIAEQPYYDLSHAQRRLWVLDQLEPGSSAYNMPAALVFEQAINIQALRKAFEVLIERHEILRTIFIEIDGSPRQQVLPVHEQRFILQYSDLRTDANREETARKLADEEANKPFDLSAGPLLRAHLLQTEDERYLFLFTMHHIISDGWSMEVLTREVLSLYESFSKEVQPSLPPLGIQYKDYAAWQHNMLQSEASSQHRSYWLQQLSGALPVLDMPADFPRPPIKTYQGDVIITHLSHDQVKQLKALAQSQTASLFMVLMASVHALLYRYTGQQDIITGTVVAGRDHNDLEQQIGFYVNTLPVRNQLQGVEGFDSLLADIRNNMLAAFAHQLYPFDRLVDDLQLERDLSRNPLFEVMVVYQHAAGHSLPTPAAGSLRMKAYDHDTIISKFDLGIHFEEQEEGVLAEWEYNTGLYERDTIQRMAQHYHTLVNALIEDPAKPIGRLEMLLPSERYQLLEEFNSHREMHLPDGQTILDHLHLAANPQRPALVMQDEVLTYGELHTQSGKLAAFLDQHDIHDQPVAVFLERSPGLVVALLAVLKAGGAYMPLDTEYPPERVNAQLAGSGCRLVVTSTKHRDLFDASHQAAFIFIDQLEEITARVDILPAQTVQPSQPAYILYTSGSTGKPKGVVISHASLLNYCLNFIDRFAVHANDRIILQSSIAFDVLVEEIYPALMTGACILIAPGGGKDVFALKKLIEQHEATLLTTTPLVVSWLNQELETPAKLRYIISGGDVLLPSQVNRLLNMLPVVNSYGPTEATVCATYHFIKDAEGSMLLGKPNAGVRVYITDSYGNPVPIGVTGELCIGGVQVAQGYLNLPELTHQQFVTDAFHGNGLNRVYRTGDRALWLKDGSIRFAGRVDEQLKVRGYRIEPGEIENACKSLPGVTHAAVVVKEHKAGETYLVAYIETSGDFNSLSILARLRELLPDYMVPAQLVQLSSMPVNANGKLDRARLPEVALLPANKKEAPGTHTQQMLFSIWTEVLDNDRIGIHDNFFESGGHSIKAAGIVSRVHKELGVKIELKDIFLHPTIAELAEVIDKLDQQAFQSIQAIPATGRYQLSYAQRRLWVLEQLNPGQPGYTISEGYALNGKVDLNILARVFNALLYRYEILRTVFIEEAGEPWQRVLDMQQQKFALQFTDLRNYPQAEQQALHEAAMEADRPFSLTQGPLLRAHLLQLQDERFVFLLSMHHIISDGRSMEVLTREMISLYEIFIREKSPGAVEIPSAVEGSATLRVRLQYRDFASWQQSFFKGAAGWRYRHYWRSALENPPPPLNLGLQYEAGYANAPEADAVPLMLAEEISAKLYQLLQEQQVTLFMFFLASLQVLFYKCSGQGDMIIGTVDAGRDHIDLEDQVGFFINPLPLRNKLQPGETFEEVLANTRRNSLESFRYKQYPFDHIIQDLGLVSREGENPLFDIVLSMQQVQQEETAGTADFRIEEFGEGSVKAPFGLIFNIRPAGKGIFMEIYFKTKHYNKGAVIFLKNALTEVLQQVITEPSMKVEDIMLEQNRKQEQEAMLDDLFNVSF